MKLKLVIMLICISSVKSQDFSISGYLDKKYTLSIPETSLTESVYHLTKSIKNIDPLFPKIKFEFIGSNISSEWKSEKVDIKNKSLREILDCFANTFRHNVRYDLSRNIIVFTAVTETGDDPSRVYTISDETSKRLGLNWDDIVKFQEKLFSYGVVVDFHEIDSKSHLFRASGSLESLDHIDMLIYVFSKMGDSKTKDFKIEKLKIPEP
jgi:hypothetical protein